MSDSAARVAPRSFPTAPVIVWVGLIVATLLSYWLGSDHGLSSAEARTLIIFVVAFVKVRFVGLYFMELRQAPVALRSLFEGWCVVVCLLLAGLYLWA
jgi:heme/copper-type cytochrome/quinol oxidase subunit 4